MQDSIPKLAVNQTGMGDAAPQLCGTPSRCKSLSKKKKSNKQEQIQNALAKMPQPKVSLDQPRVRCSWTAVETDEVCDGLQQLLMGKTTKERTGPSVIRDRVLEEAFDLGSSRLASNYLEKYYPRGGGVL